MLAGPSNAGLADPGHAMCISLNQITATLLSHSTKFQDLVAMSWLSALTEMAGEAFIEAHRKLEADEEALQQRDEEDMPAA